MAESTQPEVRTIKVNDNHLVVGSTRKLGRDYYPEEVWTSKRGTPITITSQSETWELPTDFRIECHNCGWRGTVSETERVYTPIGGKRWSENGCPECETGFFARRGSRVRDGLNNPWEPIDKERTLNAHLPE